MSTYSPEEGGRESGVSSSRRFCFLPRPKKMQHMLFILLACLFLFLSCCACLMSGRKVSKGLVVEVVIERKGEWSFETSSTLRVRDDIHHLSRRGESSEGGSAMPGNAIQARRREEDGALFECLRYLIKTTEAWHGVFDSKQGMNLDLG